MSWTQSQTRRAPQDWVSVAIDKMASLAVPQTFFLDLLRQHSLVQEIDQLARHKRWRAAREKGSLGPGRLSVFQADRLVSQKYKG
jgi:hypothetical protein